MKLVHFALRYWLSRACMLVVILFVIANSLRTSLPERRDFLRSCKELGCKNFALRISSSLDE